MGELAGGEMVRGSDRVLLAGGGIDHFNVHFGLSGLHLDPGEVTARLDTVPDNSRRRGETRPSGHGRHREGEWVLTKKGDSPDEIQEALADLLDRLPRPESWSDLRSRYQTFVTFGIHLDDWNRGFELPRELVKRLAEYDVELSFDIYYYGEQDSLAEALANQEHDSMPIPPLPGTLAFIDRINHRDLDGLLALMTDGHCLKVLEEEPSCGKERVREAWRGYFDAFPNYLIYPHRFAESGSTVAVLGHTTGSHLALPDQVEALLPLIWVAEVVGGRLSSWTIVADLPPPAPNSA